ncbi:MAG: hypothetical protein AAF480_10735, partial [Actinomycetota bacterium]
RPAVPPNAPPPPPTEPDPPAAPPPPAETARSAALWLGGTGAFLILVAAGVLVAMRWDDIAAWMKLAGLLAANVTVVGAGLRYREKVPATAAALFHLGAFMVPISAVAATSQAALDWEDALLAASATTIVALSALDRVRPSKALPAVALAAVVPFVGGVAAVTGAPAAVLLGAAALITLQIVPTRGSPIRWAALGWAGIAAALSVLVAVDDPLIRTAEVVDALGLASSSPPITHLIAGAIAAVAFGVAAQRDDSEALAIAAIASSVLGVAATLVDIDSGAGSIGLSLVALAVGVEVAASMTARHRPWSAVFGDLAVVAEIGMVLGGLWVIGEGLWAIDVEMAADDTVALAGFVLAVGWFVAGQRRRVDDCQSVWMALLTGSGWWPATVALAATLTAATGAATGSPIAVAWTAVSLAAVLVLTGRAGGHGTAAALTITAVAVLTSAGDAVLVSATAGVVLAIAAALRAGPSNTPRLGAMALHAQAVAHGFVALIALGDSRHVPAGVGGLLVVLAIAVPTVIAERATTDPVRAANGLLGRLILAVVFLPAWFGLRIADLLFAALLATALVAVDALRTRDPRLLLPLVVILPATISTIGDAAGLGLGTIGVALAIAAVSVGGIALAIDRLDVPVVALVGAAALSSLVHASTDAGSMSTTLLILGAAGIGVAAAFRSTAGFVGSAAVASVGFWARLDLLEVTWSEPFLAPAALVLVVLGAVTPSERLGSWWTHGAATGLLGGAALLERIAGGHGGHGLIAGSVAVVAIALGASARLIGPLAIGTALIVGVAGHEALAYTASVPTWAWLAGAGAVLLACAVLVERSATSPIEGGRRLVETVRAGYR